MAPGSCYIVSYDHGGLVLWGYDHFVTHLRELLGWLDRHPRFKSGLDNEAWMYDWLAENQPAVLRELREALKKYAGRLGISTCTYGQPLAAYITDESNIRQIRLGLATVRERLGYELDIYSFSEHAAFPQMPQILKQLGIRGALVRTHYLMYGYCVGADVATAWWQSPDGSRVKCVPTYVHQERQVAGHKAHPAGPFGLTTEDTWILTRYPSEISPKPLDSFCERFAHVRPILASRIDDSGLKREELVTELDAREEYSWATLEDVFDEFPEPTDVIGSRSSDFATRMPWGFRGNELFDLARLAEVTVMTAERLAAVTGVDSAEGELLQAWKDALVGQHHDIQIVSRSGPMGRERLLASLERSRGVIRSVLRAQAAPQAEASDFAVFNPLPWARTEASAVLPDGTELPGVVTAPAMGLAPFRPDGDEPVAAGLTFDTEAYLVSMAATGGMEFLRDREGHDLMLPGRRGGHLAGVIDGVECRSSGTVKVERTVAGYRVIESGKIGPLPYTIRWLFPQRGRRIEYTLEVRFNGERIGEPTKEARDSRSCFVHEKKLRACFYPAVGSDALGLHDEPFHAAATDSDYVEGNFWTAMAGREAGLAVFNRGTMGSCREKSGAFSVPVAFSTHYVWGDEVICGARQWKMGLWPWRGDWREEHLHHQALEFAFPMVAVPGTLREPRAGLEIRNPDVHLTAMYTEGGRRYVRLYNGTGVEQVVKVLAGVRVDLQHREMGPVAPELTLRAWEIVTIRL